MGILSFFKQLRPSFIVGFVILWNALCLCGMGLNGGPGPIRTVPSAAVMFLAAAVAATAGFGPMLSVRLRSLALRDGADMVLARSGLILFGTIGSMLMIGAVLTAAVIAFGDTLG